MHDFSILTAGPVAGQAPVIVPKPSAEVRLIQLITAKRTAVQRLDADDDALAAFIREERRRAK